MVWFSQYLVSTKAAQNSRRYLVLSKLELAVVIVNVTRDMPQGKLLGLAE